MLIVLYQLEDDELVAVEGELVLPEKVVVASINSLKC